MKMGYSMPPASPLYAPPPYYFKGNWGLSIVFRTAAEVLQQMLPDPLVPNPDNLAFVYVGEFHAESPMKGVYKEAGIGIPAFCGDRLGNYFALLYLDTAAAIVPGREIYGWPKKDAAIALTAEDGVSRALVSRDGVSLIEARVYDTEPVGPIPDLPDAPALNLKLIPSVKKDCPPDVLQLTSTAMPTRKRELRRGKATLSLRSSLADDLGRIPVLEILAGEQYIDETSVLGYGEVLVDYLAERRTAPRS